MRLFNRKPVPIADPEPVGPEPDLMAELGKREAPGKVDIDAIRYSAKAFFEEWIEDRGDSVPEESIRRIAARAIRAACIFEEELLKAKEGR